MSHDPVAINPVAILEDLVRINSVNAFYRGGPGEARLAGYIQAFWESMGIECWRQEVLPATDRIASRSNVIARLPGMSSDRRLLLEAHMDTVSVEGMTISPFAPEIREGRLYGRGACDTKAGLACMMEIGRAHV